MSESTPTASVSTILVGVDGGVPACRALEWALRRASHTGALVRAVWVDEERGHSDEPVTAKALAYQLERAVAAAGLTPASTPTVEQELVSGDVVDELRRRASEADLLVIGTNFHHGVIGWFRGTRALTLAADASVPVVVVPDVELDGRADVVVGVDAAGHADQAVLWAAAEAAASGQTLVLLQATPLMVGSVPAYVEVGNLHTELVEEAREAVDRLATELTEHEPGLRVRGNVTTEWPVQALSQAGRTASLVVVGSRGLGAIRRFVQGSVSSEVVLSLTGPVAIVR
ncbi:MAG: universal stress protein [Salana multivorans]|uniref:universal stress protein n=1 Tax=Salana multivorans TaxID=120377 RepID=UPI000B24F046|nr:universal stress protein [Salana multivorans]MBN8883487.1 universal stress protein [Salana multivorans]